VQVRGRVLLDHKPSLLPLGPFETLPGEGSFGLGEVPLFAVALERGLRAGAFAAREGLGKGLLQLEDGREEVAHLAQALQGIPGLNSKGDILPFFAQAFFSSSQVTGIETNGASFFPRTA
jgi:thiamine transporter ThiT